MRNITSRISIVLLISACSAPEPQRGVHREAVTVDAGAPGCPTAEPTCVTLADPVDEPDACPDHRWIAYMPLELGNCPDKPVDNSGVWSGASLFSPVSTDPALGLAPGLERFCVYTWIPESPKQGPDPGEDDVLVLETWLGNQGASGAPDCRVVVPMGSSTAVEQRWEALNTHFHQQVGRMDVLPVNPDQPLSRVRVAVVDSVPDDDVPTNDDTGISPHGWAVTRSISEIGCPVPGSSCVTELSPHLALTLHQGSSGPDSASGGYYGRISDLAVAVVDAVNEWRIHNHDTSDPDFQPQPRLVVNLSVAWEPRWGGAYAGNDVTSLPGPMRAVHAALTHLKCWGGLAIAAAGNDPGGPEAPVGPMFPARWENKPAPGKSACDDFEGQGYASGYTLARFPEADFYDPLVHAVGGVRADDQPIALTRPGGRPRLAAHAEQVVAEDVDSSGDPVSMPTAVLTGSSMAAAVTSAVAATAWGYRPDLSGAKLMALVYSSQGGPLGVDADFCLGASPCTAIRRVMLCDGIASVCAQGGGNCPSTLPGCAPRPKVRSVPSDEVLSAVRSEAELDQGVGPVSAAGITQPLPALDVCYHDGFYRDHASSDYAPNTCPYRQWGQSVRKPWSGPQPGSFPCPTCYLAMTWNGVDSYDATLYLSLDPDYPNDVKLGTLDIEGYGEIDLSSLNSILGDGTLSAGEDVVIDGISIAGAGSFDTATINMRDLMADGTDRDSSTSSELTVWEMTLP